MASASLNGPLVWNNHLIQHKDLSLEFFLLKHQSDTSQRGDIGEGTKLRMMGKRRVEFRVTNKCREGSWEYHTEKSVSGHMAKYR